LIGTTTDGGRKLEVQTNSTNAGLWVQTGGTTSAYTIADFRTGSNLSALQILGNGVSTFNGTINSNSQINQNGGGVIALYNETNSAYWYMRVLSTYSDNFRFNYNGTDKAEIIKATGVYTSLSDINKKKDFEYSTIGLNEILGLKPTLYRMKSDNETSDKHLGFIAQQVKEFIPQAYVENGDFIGLQDRPIIAALVKAIQELQAKLDKNNIN
jgi:hypothetical protein